MDRLLPQLDIKGGVLIEENTDRLQKSSLFKPSRGEMPIRERRLRRRPAPVPGTRAGGGRRASAGRRVPAPAGGAPSNPSVRPDGSAEAGEPGPPGAARGDGDFLKLTARNLR